MNLLAYALMGLLIIVAVMLAAVLVWFVAGSFRSGEAKVQSAVKRAAQLRNKQAFERAEGLLNATLKGNGYDYQTYLIEAKRNPSSSIVRLAPRFNLLARRLRLTNATNEFLWCWPAFLGLGELYEAQGRHRQAARLYNDLLSFIEDQGENLEREFATEARQVCYEGAARAYTALGEFEQAVGCYGAAWVERIHLLKLRDFKITLKDEHPLKKHEQIAQILAQVGRSELEAETYALLNSCARLDTSTFDPVRAQRQVEALLRGIHIGQSREREAAKLLLRGIMDKMQLDTTEKTDAPQPKKDKEEDSGEGGDKGPGDDIIYL